LAGNWDSEMGGIHRPKHLGQSGHPIPAPDDRTNAPTQIKNTTSIRLITADVRNHDLRRLGLLFIMSFAMRRIISPFIELIKPRIAVMQLVTVSMGFIVARINCPTALRMLLPLLIGTFLTASGSAALNHFLERNIDGKMERTKHRPLPAGLFQPWVAATIGFSLLAAGILVLWVWTNSWVTFLSFLTAFLYVIFYTPLKQMTWINTYVGAIPGAIPPLAGWGAVTGHLAPGAWELFIILFLWQMPHFFAIAWMYKADYSSAGFKMLSADDRNGSATYMHMAVNGLLLVLASLLPAKTAGLGPIYATSALALGVWLLVKIRSFKTVRDFKTARHVMKASVIYLPLLLAAILLAVILQHYSAVG